MKNKITQETTWCYENKFFKNGDRVIVFLKTGESVKGRIINLYGYNMKISDCVISLDEIEDITFC